jgi:hypothetical protein
MLQCHVMQVSVEKCGMTMEIMFLCFVRVTGKCFDILKGGGSDEFGPEIVRH